MPDAEKTVLKSIRSLLKRRNADVELHLDSDLYDDLMLEYVAFAPGTAKVVTTGRSYMNGRRTGPVVVGPGGTSTSALYREKLLEMAGEDAGDRILKALHRDVNIPSSP